MNKKSLLGNILHETKPFHPVMFTYLLFVVIENVFSLALPYLIGKSTDAIVSNQGFDIFLRYFFVGVVVLVLSNIFSLLLAIYENSKFTFKFDKFLNFKTISKVLTFSIGQVRNENSGMTQSVVNRGQGKLSELIFNFIYGVFPSSVKSIIAIIAIMFLNIQLGIVTLVGVASFLFFAFIINVKFGKRLRDSFDAEDEMNKNSTEIIRFTSHIALNAEEEFSKDRFSSIADNYVNKSISVWNSFEIFSIVKDVCIIATKLAIFFLSGLFVYRGTITIGDFIIVNMWINIATAELGFISRMHRRISASIESIKKYFDILGTKPAIINEPKVDREIMGEIEFENVSFEYPVEKIVKKLNENDNTEKSERRGDALKNVSFRVNLGEKLAIVGKSGSGKSTIVNLICRGYDPQAGRVVIDGNDLKDYDYKKYRMSLGVVEQDVVLLDRTLRENLLFGIQDKNSVSEERIIEVCEQTTLSELLKKLPQKLETKVGERGVKLSGGEKQRVGIARALLRNPKILIFDEATSHLDPLNERLIKDSIDKVSKGRTTIIIAHRLSTVLDADRIIVMNDGQLINIGNHAELIKSSEIYRDLVNSQMID